MQSGPETPEDLGINEIEYLQAKRKAKPNRVIVYSPRITEEHPYFLDLQAINLKARMKKANIKKRDSGGETQIARDMKGGFVFCFPGRKRSTIEIPGIEEPLPLKGPMGQLIWPGNEDAEKYANRVGEYVALMGAGHKKDELFLEEVLGIMQGHLATFLEVFQTQFKLKINKQLIPLRSIENSFYKSALVSYPDGTTRLLVNYLLYFVFDEDQNAYYRDEKGNLIQVSGEDFHFFKKALLAVQEQVSIPDWNMKSNLDKFSRHGEQNLEGIILDINGREILITPLVQMSGYVGYVPSQLSKEGAMVAPPSDIYNMRYEIFTDAIECVDKVMHQPSQSRKLLTRLSGGLRDLASPVVSALSPRSAKPKQKQKREAPPTPASARSGSSRTASAEPAEPAAPATPAAADRLPSFGPLLSPEMSDSVTPSSSRSVTPPSADSLTPSPQPSESSDLLSPPDPVILPSRDPQSARESPKKPDRPSSPHSADDLSPSKKGKGRQRSISVGDLEHGAGSKSKRDKPGGKS